MPAQATVIASESGRYERHIASNVVRMFTSTRPAENVSAPDKDCLLKAWVNSFAPGETQMGAVSYAIVCMHLGSCVEVRCSLDGSLRYGRRIAGDLDIIPARTRSAWATKHGGTTLIMRVPEGLLRKVATQLRVDSSSIEIADRFQMRDPIIEHIGWAMKADIEAGHTGGRVFRESMGTALAVRLLQRHYRGSLPMQEARGGLSPMVLQHVLAYIDDNLPKKLSLAQIAVVAGYSVSHLKVLFRTCTGAPVHQYVLRRRVERAQMLLQNRSLSIAQVACETGFAHQSHLARHMRKIFGSAPAMMRESFKG